METGTQKKVLISGASMAGLSAAFCLHKIGYNVTVVEMAGEPRVNGAAVDLRGRTVDTVKRMGLFDQLKQHRLNVERIDVKNADDTTVNTLVIRGESEEPPTDEIEIERDKFVAVMLDALKGKVEFMFSNSITALQEMTDGMQVSFKHGPQQVFGLVLGCDGIHSNARRLWFGEEAEYAHFLEAYFSITIVNKLLVPQNTMQAFNVPCKGIMLNAYNGKTDIILTFVSEKEIAYDYRNVEQQMKMILEQFAGVGWRTAELLEEVKNAKGFYFDKFCQVKMPSWTKGRVALVGDAGYCASPAAGMGASLAVEGAAVLADALQKHGDNYALAFEEYNNNLRPFIEEVQATAAVNVREHFIPRTEEEIAKRNAMTEMV